MNQFLYGVVEEFINRNHTPGRGHPNAGGVTTSLYGLNKPRPNTHTKYRTTRGSSTLQGRPRPAGRVGMPNKNHVPKNVERLIRQRGETARNAHHKLNAERGMQEHRTKAHEKLMERLGKESGQSTSDFMKSIDAKIQDRKSRRTWKSVGRTS